MNLGKSRVHNINSSMSPNNQWFQILLIIEPNTHNVMKNKNPHEFSRFKSSVS